MGTMRPLKRFHVANGDALFAGGITSLGLSNMTQLRVLTNLSVTHTVSAYALSVTNLHIAGFTNLAQSLSVQAITVSGPLVANGQSTVNGPLSVTDRVTAPLAELANLTATTLQVTGNASIAGALTVAAMVATGPARYFGYLIWYSFQYLMAISLQFCKRGNSTGSFVCPGCCCDGCATVCRWIARERLV